MDEAVETVSFLLSASAALGLALLLYRRPLWESALSLVLEALRVIPPLSLVSLLILWLGIDEAPKLAIVVLASFFPIYLSALTALRSVSSKYKELAQMLGLTESARVQEISAPRGGSGHFDGTAIGIWATLGAHWWAQNSSLPRRA